VKPSPEPSEELESDWVQHVLQKGLRRKQIRRRDLAPKSVNQACRYHGSGTRVCWKGDRCCFQHDGGGSGASSHQPLKRIRKKRRQSAAELSADQELIQKAFQAQQHRDAAKMFMQSLLTAHTTADWDPEVVLAAHNMLG
jgi:hypothetical protein